nr:shikimate kinase [Gordonia zhaorongruii]
MGSGKSTVGRALASALSVEFVDTDTEIERRSGRTIPEIFESDGESGFREIEATTVRDVLATTSGVVALGGGSPTVPSIRAALAGHHVIYLEIDADDGFVRVAGSDRPLLAGADPAARYAAILSSRVDDYRSVAVVTADASAPVGELVISITAGLPEIGSDPTEPPPEGETR